jgi:hypothetical protein
MTGGNARLSSAQSRRSTTFLSQGEIVASVTTQPELVGLLAAEIASGIDDAVGYWLARIEREVLDPALSPAEQVREISRVLREYKEVTGKPQIRYGVA